MEEDNKREIIRANLEGYPFIKRFFGDIIEQRLKIDCFTHGMLTAPLLSLEELKEFNLLALEITKFDLQRLEIVLQFGNSCCENFDFIFREDRLAQYEDADEKIVNILAEVRAFEFLCRYTFKDISKIRQILKSKTVDFISKRNTINYAIEVTRPGLAKSDKKQAVYDHRVSTLKWPKCEDASGGEGRLPPKEGINVERIKAEIHDAIDKKYAQLSGFLKDKDNSWKGVLLISSGRDYFIARRYENKGYEDVRVDDFIDALEQIWKFIKAEGRDKYLHHLVITRGKDLKKVVIYPHF